MNNPVELAEMALPRLKLNKNHHKYLPYDQLPDFIRKLKTSNISCSNKLAIEFAILTAGRTSEILKARWDEIDFRERERERESDRSIDTQKYTHSLSPTHKITISTHFSFFLFFLFC